MTFASSAATFAIAGEVSCGDGATPLVVCLPAFAFVELFSGGADELLLRLRTR